MRERSLEEVLSVMAEARVPSGKVLPVMAKAVLQLDTLNSSGKWHLSEGLLFLSRADTEHRRHHGRGAV